MAWLLVTRDATATVKMNKRNGIKRARIVSLNLRARRLRRLRRRRLVLSWQHRFDNARRYAS